MHHVMFDIDGTLVQSDAFDGEYFLEAMLEVVGHRLDPDWTRYTHVTDTGILDQLIGEIGLQAKRERVHAEVKAVFVAKIASHLKANTAQQIRGTSEFMSALRRRGNIGLSIATGGGRPAQPSPAQPSPAQIRRLALFGGKVGETTHAIQYDYLGGIPELVSGKVDQSRAPDLWVSPSLSPLSHPYEP